MSFITEKYKANKLHFNGLAIGWYFEETFEFCPLSVSAVMELYVEGYIDEDIVYATSVARDKIINELFSATDGDEPFTEEDTFDMELVHGADADVSNVFTGEILQLAEF